MGTNSSVPQLGYRSVFIIQSTNGRYYALNMGRSKTPPSHDFESCCEPEYRAPLLGTRVLLDILEEKLGPKWFRAPNLRTPMWGNFCKSGICADEYGGCKRELPLTEVQRQQLDAVFEHGVKAQTERKLDENDRIRRQDLKALGTDVLVVISSNDKYYVARITGQQVPTVSTPKLFPVTVKVPFGSDTLTGTAMLLSVLQQRLGIRWFDNYPVWGKFNVAQGRVGAHMELRLSPSHRQQLSAVFV